MITDAQTIIDRANLAAAVQNLDDRGRLAYEVGVLHGQIKTLCHYVKFLEIELAQAQDAQTKLEIK